MRRLFTGSSSTINYPDDLYGDVIFYKDDESFTVPGEDLENLIKTIIINRKISQVKELKNDSLDEIIRKL